MKFKTSLKLNELLDQHDVGDLIDCIDSIDGSCTTGYDNDGSTGLELFYDGVQLGKLAGNRSIYVYKEDGIAVFFIGEENDILERLQKELKDED